MNFCETTPNDIYEWIEKKNNGDETYYLNGKQDTEEAIDVFRSLYGRTFRNVYGLFCYLHQHLCMRVARSQSLYRAFIVLNNDEIITLRLSRHFSTKAAAKRAFRMTGKPDIEYHLVIGRVKQLNPYTDVYYDRMLSYVEVKVREYDLSEFNDGDIRNGIIDEIIALLTNGTNKGKKLIRFTEADLRRIVNKILCENIELNENTNDRKVNKLLKDYYHTDDFTKIREYRANFLNLMPNARSRNEKWLYRVLQWYLNGDIPKEEIKRLDKFLGWLNNNRYDNKDINDSDWHSIPFLWIKQAYDRMFPSRGNVLNNTPLTRKVTKVNGFTIRRLDSQDEAQELGETVYNGEWCILDNLFEEQVDNCTCYIISNDKTYASAEPMPLFTIIKMLKKLGLNDIVNEINPLTEYDYSDVTDITDWSDDYFDVADTDNGLPPYDKYGLSAIVVLIGPDGETYGVYSRYNLPNMCDGWLLDKKGLSQLIGVDIDTVCPYVKK